MRRNLATSLTALSLTALAACGQSQPEAQGSGEQAGTPAAEGQPVPSTGPTSKPGGGLVAEESGVEGNLAIKIRWESQTVKGIPEEGQIIEVYKRTAQLLCPVTCPNYNFI
jgi:hypothetical protein